MFFRNGRQESLCDLEIREHKGLHVEFIGFIYHEGAPVRIDGLQIASLRGHSSQAGCTLAHSRGRA